jgi:nitrogen fixation protein
VEGMLEPPVVKVEDEHVWGSALAV